MAFKRHTFSQNRTNARALASATIESYSPVIKLEGPRTGMQWARLEATYKYARKRGWTVRTDPRGWVKCMDPKTGNVAFGQYATGAIAAMSGGLWQIYDYQHALMRIFTERRGNGDSQT